MLEPREAAPKPASEHTTLELPTFHDDLADLFDTDNFTNFQASLQSSAFGTPAAEFPRSRGGHG